MDMETTDVVKALAALAQTHRLHVSQQRNGRHLIYRVEFDRMNGVLAYLTENCCQGAEDCLTASATSCHC